MTISSTTRKAGPFSCDGVTTVFPFTFKVFAAADLLVVLNDGSETTLTPTTHYTVSLNSDQDNFPGGSVTTTTAYTSGKTITLAGNLENLQPVDVTNLGGFYPAVFTKVFDRLTILVQQVAETASRGLRLPLTTPAGVSAQLAPPEGGKLIGWAADGLSLTNFSGVPTVPATPYAEGLLGSADASAARTALGISMLPQLVLNGAFNINQLGISGTVTLTAGQYGHDGWKGGASGCTYSFAVSGNRVTITITSGTLVQTIAGSNLFTGTYCLSWVGTATGRIASGSYGASGITASIVGNTNTNIEFSTGTLTKVQLDPGSLPLAYREVLVSDELHRCQYYYQASTAQTTAHTYSTVNAIVPQVSFTRQMASAPTVVMSSPSGGFAGTASVNSVSNNGFRVLITGAGYTAHQNNFYSFNYTASARL